MNMSSWATISFSFDATPGILAFSIFVGGAMGVLGGLLPAFHAARTSPVEAMRD
jgi:ABC-type antimicrobial peptide transport system permease subunit